MKILLFRRGRYLLVFFAVAAVAVLLWAANQSFPNPVTAVLTPINDSPWEWGKFLFWPYLLAAVILRNTGDAGEEKGSECLLFLLLPAMVTTGKILFPGSSPVVLCGTVLVMGLTAYALFLRRKLWGGALLWYTLAILLGIAYLLFTALPPIGGIFLPADTVVVKTIPF